MRAALGPALAHLVLLAAGYGVLWVTGVLRRPTPLRLLAAAGLAYLAGVAVVMVALILLLVVGVPLSLGLFVVLCALCAAPATLGLRHRDAWRVPDLRARWRGMDVEARIAAGIAVGLFAVFVVLVAGVGVQPLSAFDAWQLWTRKGILLFYDAHLPVGVFTSKIAYANVQPDYPLGLPMLEAMQFRAGGRPDTQESQVAGYLVFAAGMWALAYLGSRVARPLVAIGVPAGIAVVLAVPALSGLADLPAAVFVGTGTLAVGLWLQERRPPDLALGAVLLAGAAVMKNEGLTGAVVVCVAAIVACLAARRRRDALVVAGAAVATAVVAVLPWRIWMAAHDVQATLDTSKGLSPSYLVDRFDRVWPSVESLTAQIAVQPEARATVAVGIALALVRLRRVPVLAGFYLAVGLLYFLALIWAYWISPLGLQFHISTSVGRIYVGLVLIGAAGILHLGRSDFDADEPPTLPATTQTTGP